MNKEELFEFHIRNNWFKISRYYNQLAAKFNMSFSWGFILLNIERDGTPSTALGPKMGMESTSLSRTLKKMENENYIVRKNDAIDKRKALVYLTEKGLKLRKEARDVVLNFNQKLYASIPEKEVQSFFSTMQKVDALVSGLLEDEMNYKEIK